MTLRRRTRPVDDDGGGVDMDGGGWCVDVVVMMWCGVWCVDGGGW